MHDWPISRQVVWGIRIPAWYDVDKNPKLMVTFLDKNGESNAGVISKLLEKYDIEEIEISKGDYSAILKDTEDITYDWQKLIDEANKEDGTSDKW